MSTLADRPTDPVLRPYLQAGSDAEARRCLEAILRQTEPVVTGIIRRRWSPGSEPGNAEIGEDIRADVFAQLAARLTELRAAAATDRPETIHDFRGFTAVTALRVCDTYLRRRHPAWARLKRKLEYLLDGRAGCRGFALWAGPAGERLCGFETWARESRPPLRGVRLQQLLEDPHAVVRAALPHDTPGAAHPGDLLAAIFNWTRAPLELPDLVRAVGRLWGVTDRPSSEAELDPDLAPDLSLRPPEDELAAREYLAAIWREIRELPGHQRSALLLNLRDSTGRGVLPLLPVTQVASPREIAEALGMEPASLARLWPDLPLDDLRIAGLLGCSRQQVINARRSARDRLERRLRSFAE